MTWRLAKSLEALRNQVNKAWPKRSKAADGSIGDAAHASRSSDHNPWVKDGGAGVVTAIDITHDPKGGCDAGRLADVLVASRDPRIKYIIWNRRIVSGAGGPSPWTWRKYTGSNPHSMHVHISAQSSKALYDDAGRWALPGGAPVAEPTAPPPPAAALKRPTIRKGAKGEHVEALQKLLGIDVDGKFGKATEAAVKAAQKKARLGADGVVGPYTWAALAA